MGDCQRMLIGPLCPGNKYPVKQAKQYNSSQRHSGRHLNAQPSQATPTNMSLADVLGVDIEADRQTQDKK
eukprot:IDg22230t1